MNCHEIAQSRNPDDFADPLTLLSSFHLKYEKYNSEISHHLLVVARGKSHSHEKLFPVSPSTVNFIDFRNIVSELGILHDVDERSIICIINKILWE